MKQTFSITHFFIISAVILLMMPSLIRAQEPNWLVRLRQQRWMNKIANLKILKTNRLEAEKILGKPDIRGYEKTNFIQFYNIKNGRVILTYTTKECTSVDGKIAKDTLRK